MTGNAAAAAPAANAGEAAPVVPAAAAVDPNASPSEGGGGAEIPEGGNVAPAAPAAPDPAAPAAPAAPAEEGAPEGAPEVYEAFTVPEGMELDPESTTAFSEAAKAANLPQAKAQQLVDLASGLVKREVEKTIAGFQEQATERVAQWAEQVKVDPVVGGPKYSENVQVALEAVGAFGDPELKQAFDEFGLGNHPAFVRAFYRIGKAIKESGSVHGMGLEQPAKSANPEVALAQRIAAEQARNPAGKGPRK